MKCLLLGVEVQCAPLTEESGRRAVRYPLAGKQGSLWKMLSVRCGFTATVSTSTILVLLVSWPSRSSLSINMSVLGVFLHLRTVLFADVYL